MNKLQTIKKTLLLLFVLAVFANNSLAEDKPDIQTENFWIVLAPDVARSTAGYGVIKNNGNAADTLIRIRSDAAMVMLHKTEVDAGMAQMIHMPNLVIDANSELVLEPMSFHLMLSDLSPALFNEGENIILFLEFEKSGVIKVKATVLPPWH